MTTKKKDNDLAILAAKAEQAMTDGDQGGFISGGLITSDFAIVLGGCLEFDTELPEFERNRIVLKVAHDPALPRPITAEVLLKTCSKLEREYLKQPKRSFRLLTEISLWWTVDVPKTKVGATTMTFKPKRIKGFVERAKLFQEQQPTVGFELPHNYMQLAALVKARTPHEAAERALNDIDLMRASWNLSLNRGKIWRSSSGRPVPVNDIRLSPFHTVHEANGELATATYWYDPSYTKPASPYSDKTKFGRLTTFAKNLRSKLAQLPYRLDMERLLIRYVRALDSADLNDAFLRLWSVLEHLTDSAQDPSKVTARRAAFMFSDRERSQLVLTHLTNHRNRFVHAGSDTDNIESLVFMLKRYVDALLLFHLGNPFGFMSRGEAARFMDLPVTRAEIDVRIKQLRQARRYLSSSP